MPELIVSGDIRTIETNPCIFAQSESCKYVSISNPPICMHHKHKYPNWRQYTNELVQAIAQGQST